MAAIVLARVAPAEDDVIANQVLDRAEAALGAQQKADHCGGDKNSDGKLDFTEFKALARQKSQKIDDEELLRRFKELDKSGDGFVDIAEYLHSRSPLVRALRQLRRPVVQHFTQAVVLSSIYVLIGVLGYTALEPEWTNVDALYFSMATMSTVGYGDISPSSWNSRVLTLFMIFFGVIFVFVEVSKVIGYTTKPLTSSGRQMLEKAFPQVGVDLDADGSTDYYKPRHPLIYYSKNLLPSFALNMSVQLASAAIFVSLDDTWSYGDAVYHCLVTATTVGYGDVTNGTQGGRLWSCFHILLSVAMLGELISTFDALSKKRAATMARVSQLARKLDAPLLDQLLTRAKAMRPLVVRDGKGLTELEFVLAMLIELDIVDWDQVQPFVKQFRTLDVNGDARLGHEDLELSLKHSPSELRKMLQERDEVPMSVSERMGISFDRRKSSCAVSPSSLPQPEPQPEPPSDEAQATHADAVQDEKSMEERLDRMSTGELEALYATIGSKLASRQIVAQDSMTEL